jgi:hypothetical protein
MPKKKAKNTLIERVGDQRWIDFFYLELGLDKLIERLHRLRLKPAAGGRDVPFNAQIRGYTGATDDDGHLWLLKPVEEKEAFNCCLGELAYLLDFELETLSAPTLLIRQDGAFYRATKVIVHSMQVSSYDYLQEPFRRTLANDLINRWLMFDEDRNPNNYMVIHNARNDPLVVAIDFNHADLESEDMKITGDEKQFGWHRTEKTRFLTLLKPSNFEIYGIEDFEERLALLAELSEARLKELCLRLFTGVVPDAARRAARITRNLIKRRKYIDAYFRRWFPPRAALGRERKDAQYEGLGKSFVEQYKRKI